MTGGKISTKQINSHLHEISEEEQLIKLRIDQLNRELEQKQKTKNKLNSKKKKLEKRGPDVSEHAMLRYFQRVKGGEETDVLRDYILHPSILDMMKTLGGSGTFPHPDGFSVVFKNQLAITVVK